MVEHFTNYNLTDIVTPIDGGRLVDLLRQVDYPEEEIKFLKEGFETGFDLCYRGPTHRRDRSTNITFTVGNKYVLWEKMIKEVKEKRFAGPYDEIHFKYFIQSPVGLVPKSGGKTRLIFHLSYNFSQDKQQQSVNYFIPKDLCSVRYNDLDSAVRACLAISEEGHHITGSRMIYLGKSDGLSAFRTLPLRRGSWPWLVMLAIDPDTGKQQFFVDKCLPFGSSISCSHYQRFSDAVRHLTCYRMTIICVINYLDDFLFIQYTLELCNNLMSRFLQLCEDIGMPIAFDKTKWGSTTVIFLGNLLDGQKLYISIPLDKKDKALQSSMSAYGGPEPYCVCDRH